MLCYAVNIAMKGNQVWYMDAPMGKSMDRIHHILRSRNIPQVDPKIRLIKYKRLTSVDDLLATMFKMNEFLHREPTKPNCLIVNSIHALFLPLFHESVDHGNHHYT